MTVVVVFVALVVMGLVMVALLSLRVLLVLVMLLLLLRMRRPDAIRSRVGVGRRGLAIGSVMMIPLSIVRVVAGLVLERTFCAEWVGC